MRQSSEISWDDLEPNVVKALEALPDRQARCVVTRFCEATFSRISNKSGFLMGIIRRVEQEGVDTFGPADISRLPRRVRNTLHGLLDEGRIATSDLDRRMCQLLESLHEDHAVAAVEKFAASNLEAIRSKTGFMIGIVRRMETGGGAGSSQHTGSGYDAGPYAAPYGIYSGLAQFTVGHGGGFIPYRGYAPTFGLAGFPAGYYGGYPGHQPWDGGYSYSRSRSRGRRVYRESRSCSHSRSRSRSSRSYTPRRSPYRSPRRRDIGASRGRGIEVRRSCSRSRSRRSCRRSRSTGTQRASKGRGFLRNGSRSQGR
mmetsp:Transcript_37804/g.106831  ORF Transcript_37804/g.106831 Transcript_37804/m.106831 type:complete len:313 (-) Transcript_37804:177-1115(-)